MSSKLAVLTPYLKGFVFVLPDSVPIFDKAVWRVGTDEREPMLDGISIDTFEGSPAVKFQVGEGQNFVLLRFHQVDDISPAPFETDHDALIAGFDQVYSGPVNPEPVSTDLPVIERHRTVVEAVTFVAAERDLVATEQKPDPLTRCLEALFEFHRSFRIFAIKPVEELTYRRIFPIVLTYRRSLDSTTAVPDGSMTLNITNMDFGDMSDHIGKVDFDNVVAAQERLRLQDPVMNFTERMTDANFSLEKRGNFGEAVLSFGIACEVLFSGLLGLMMWEENVSEAEAAEIFSQSFATRIKHQYHKRLGKNWSIRAGAMGAWNDKVAALRHRVVHGGYRPTVEEAHAARDAVVALNEFICDRLCAKALTYKKTSWILAGSEGFNKRGGPTGQIKRWQEACPPNEILVWIDNYQGWRTGVDGLVRRREKAQG